ncbi:MAG: hypothetical protein HQK97_09955 [Nitrospirae bacterium]|nr:hypothetical protein [Nitrospirota bacterium]
MDADSLKSIIEKAAKRHIDLTITDNSSSMMSLRHRGNGSVSLRIHRMFLAAPAAVIEEITAFVKTRSKKTPLIREFIRNNHTISETRPKRRTAITHQGKFHNLKLIYDALNEEYFGGSLSLEITWGRRQTKTACRGRRLGSCDSVNGLITIHRALDTPAVPRYLIQYVVYHEMLHGSLGVELKNGRRSIHGRDFKHRERLFKDFDRVVHFLKFTF